MKRTSPDKILEFKVRGDLSSQYLAGALDRLQAARDFARGGAELGYLAESDLAVIETACEKIRQSHTSHRPRTSKR